MKFKLLAFLAVGMLAGSSAFAGDKACCAATAGNKSGHGCSATFARLDLTAEQKTKMETLAQECEKGGCNEATHTKMAKGAQKILNKDQFAAWEAACRGKTDEKTRS
ncbi:MAG: hypothetical protein ABR589_02760 [Chthoniobacterales bacterium]